VTKRKEKGIMPHEELKSKVGKSATKIWEAYQDALKELKRLSEEKPSSTTEVAQRLRTNEAIKAVADLDIESLQSRLEDLVSGIVTSKQQYDAVMLALTTKKTELQDVHGIVAAADSLAALGVAKTQWLAEVQEKHDAIVAAAQVRLTELDQSITEKRAVYQQENQRLHAEDAYSFGRMKQQREDALKDELDTRMKVVASREAALDDAEGCISALRREIEDLNTSLETRIASEVEKTRKSAEQSANIAKAMAFKTHEAEMLVANAKIESQLQQVEDLMQRLTVAQTLVASSADKVTAMAQSVVRAGADAATVARIAEVAAGSGKK